MKQFTVYYKTRFRKVPLFRAENFMQAFEYCEKCRWKHIARWELFGFVIFKEYELDFVE